MALTYIMQIKITHESRSVEYLPGHNLKPLQWNMHCLEFHDGTVQLLLDFQLYPV